MIYQSAEMETKTILDVAFGMCTAARTAPKARGIDNIRTLVLTGEEKKALSEKMAQIAAEKGVAFFARDAKNVLDCGAIVLIGVVKKYAGLTGCSFCGFADCGVCAEKGGRCAFNSIDLGIALGSAVAFAADHRIDNRIMFSAGRAYMELDDGQGTVWFGIPLFATGKNPTFDRQM